MPNVDVDSLTLKVTSDAKSATKGLDALINTLDRLKEATSGGCGLDKVSKEMTKLKNVNIGLSAANNKTGKSFTNLATKGLVAFQSVKRLVGVVSSWIDKSNKYVETANLFSIVMGEYASSAKEYAEHVGEVMGIDPAAWMKSQGVFMTLATGFGVTSDRAAVMSQQLTQLGYDLSSFCDITVEDAMQKLQSGFAGELEPLRRLGYDLSQAKLEATALSLGIDKSVSSMTQAEKAQLRYYAIMTQLTESHGDMARTLESPANQLRILQAQFDQAGRAIGNIFIPALNAVLPYIIAATKVLRVLADIVSSLVGFTLPEVDYSGLGGVSTGAEDVSASLDDATSSAKKFKKTLLGIDELNVLTDNSSSESGADDGAGGFSFDLPTYDFIGDATNNRVNEIVEKMKEWLGITGEITSWADLMHTRFGGILTVVGAIGAAITAWKVAQGVTGLISTLSSLFGKKKKGAADGATGGISIKNTLKQLANIAIIVGGVVALVGAIGLLTKIPGFNDVIHNGLQSVKDLFIGLLPALIPITLVCVEMRVLGSVKVGTVSKGLANAAIIIGGTAVLITAIGALLSIPYFDEFLSRGITSVVDTFNGLYEIALPIGVLSALLVALGLATPATIALGLAGLAIVIGGLEVVLVALGALKQIPGFDWIVSEGAAVIEQLGNTIGRFSGAIVGGFAEGMSSSFPKIGQDLADFMINAKPFFDGLCGINAAALSAVKNMAEMVLILTKASIRESLTSWFTGGNSLIEFGKDLNKFAPNFVKYSNTIKDVDASAIESSSIAAKSIVEFANNIPNSGGVVAWFAGNNDIDVFGEKLPSFGKNFKKYSDNIKGLDGKAVENSVEAAKSVVAFSKNIPNSGGVAAWFAGNNDIDVFGKKLPAFGENFKKYSDSVKGIDATVVSTTTSIAQAIVSLCRNIPNSGGVASWFTGDNDIAKFGEKLAKFGKSFREYYDQIKTISTSTISAVSSSIDKIIDFSIRIKDKVDINRINNFTDALKKMGTAIKNLPTSKTISLTINQGGTASDKVVIGKVPLFASGGYPATGEVFIAREAGPEMVGSIGNRTAVANNDQIVESVSKGVYQAVVSAMGQSGGNQVVEAKVNDKVLFEVVVSRNRQETMRTGYSPLLGGV